MQNYKFHNYFVINDLQHSRLNCTRQQIWFIKKYFINSLLATVITTLDSRRQQLLKKITCNLICPKQHAFDLSLDDKAKRSRKLASKTRNEGVKGHDSYNPQLIFCLNITLLYKFEVELVNKNNSLSTDSHSKAYLHSLQ